MILTAVCSAVIGLAIALAALSRYPDRFRHRNLTLATGPGAAVLGAALAHTVLGAGNLPIVLPVAGAFAAAMLSLLVKNRERSRPAAAYLAGRPVR
ncbi:hypothetical protein GCM10010400_63630 [Streptomyces aculeolatus]|nr:hypothetical protein [Streptomyces aculeolatus]